MPKPGEIGGLLRRFVYETHSLHDMEPFGGRLNQGFGGRWKLLGYVFQQKG